MRIVYDKETTGYSDAYNQNDYAPSYHEVSPSIQTIGILPIEQNIDVFLPNGELNQNQVGIIPMGDYTGALNHNTNLTNDGEIINIIPHAPILPLSPGTVSYGLNSPTPSITLDATLQAVRPVGTLPTVNTTPSPSTQIGEVLGVVGGTVLGNLLNGVLTTLPGATQAQVGDAGASIVDNTIKAWWKKNWKATVGIALGVIFVGTFLVKFIYKPKAKTYKKR